MTTEPSTLCLIAQHLDLHVARHLGGASPAELETLFTVMNAQSPTTQPPVAPLTSTGVGRTVSPEA